MTSDNTQLNTVNIYGVHCKGDWNLTHDGSEKYFLLFLVCGDSYPFMHCYKLES